MKSVMKKATVFVLDDPTINGQCLLAISSEGCLFLPAPGGSVVTVTIEKAREYFTGPASGMEAADEIRKAIDEIEGQVREEMH